MRKRKPITVSNVAIIPLDGSYDDAVEWVHEHLTYEDAQGQERKTYTEHPDYIAVPRGAFGRMPGDHEVDDRTSFVPTAIKVPLLSLRPHQCKPVSKMIKTGGGVLQAPTGSGKTIMMLHIASALQQRTLILVHTKDLLSQWEDQVNAVLGMKAGVIGDGVWEEEHITIGMVQTLMRYKQLPADWVSEWGCIMHDEVHRSPAESFAHVVSQMTARYLYGATATPTRRDGQHPLMEAMIGPVVARVQEEKLVKAGTLLRPAVVMVPTAFDTINGKKMNAARNKWQRQMIYGKIIAELAEDEQRMRLVASRVCKNKGSHQLVLSERIEHLYGIERHISNRNPDIRTFVLTGKHSSRERADVIQMMRDGHLDVLLATQLADEGLDLPILNVLHLTFPRRAVQKLQQQVGRIMRTADGKLHTTVYDYVDEQVSPLRTQAEVRWRWYAEEKRCDMRGWEPKGLPHLKARIKRLKEQGQLAKGKDKRK